MKRRGQHPKEALSAVKVKNLTAPGRYPDGNGLYLFIDTTGAKRWVLRTVIKGVRRDLGLGSVRLVPLVDARAEATRLRRMARGGGDPLAEKRQEKAAAITFEGAARKVYDDRKDSWRNAKHRSEWIATLENYAFPKFGPKRIGEVTSADILKALSPIWLSRSVTAKRVLQRVGTVMDWAKGQGYRAGDNPVEEAMLGLAKQPKRVRHLPAMPFVDVPVFVRDLPAIEAPEGAKLALELLILNALRTSEVLKASSAEFDLENEIWTIPSERMKSEVEHRVPLCPRSVEIVRKALKLTQGNEMLFPGRGLEKSLGPKTLLRILQAAGQPYTVHGFRSSFRDWAAEKTAFPRDLCEMALAHVIKDQSEAAYRRGDMFDRRRKLMEAWGAYIASTSGKVVQLRGAQ